MVSTDCNHDQHRACHTRGCLCGCHVLFPLIRSGK